MTEEADPGGPDINQTYPERDDEVVDATGRLTPGDNGAQPVQGKAARMLYEAERRAVGKLTRDVRFTYFRPLGDGYSGRGSLHLSYWLRALSLRMHG